MKYIIIGGVAAGMSAASKIKRTEKDAVVHVYEKGSYLSYGACGLAYYVGGYNNDHTKMIARTRAQFDAAGIQTFLRHEVTGVDVYGKSVTVRNEETGQVLTDTYDRLMVATGAAAMLPPVPGINKEGVYTLKTMEDGLLLKKAVGGYGIHDVVVIGGGYIGVEVAEVMRALGKSVRLIELAPRILTTFDTEIAGMALKEIEGNGVTVHTGERVEALKGNAAVNSVVTDQGEYVADMVVCAAGVRPSTAFLANTGIAMEQNGAIVTDRMLRTNIQDVYAAGDCAMVYDLVKNSNVYMPLGTVANKCGRIAGANMCGGSDEFAGSVGSAALKVFGLELGRTGMGEEEAKQAGYNCASVVVDSSNHPPYYPGQEKITIKLVYERPSMRILGAQLCGGQGTALRADIFATALHNEMTTKQLGMADLIYSPPYAGVWDAVHIACNAAK